MKIRVRVQADHDDCSPVFIHGRLVIRVSHNRQGMVTYTCRVFRNRYGHDARWFLDDLTGQYDSYVYSERGIWMSGGWQRHEDDEDEEEFDDYEPHIPCPRKVSKRASEYDCANCERECDH